VGNLSGLWLTACFIKSGNQLWGLVVNADEVKPDHPPVPVEPVDSSIKVMNDKFK